MIDAPFAEVKRNMVGGDLSKSPTRSNAVFSQAAGTAPISFTSTQLGKIRHPDEERAVKEVAGAMYVSGVDTTVSTISYFVLAMLSNPDAQRKAQEEIDSVVGDGRLPNFADEPFLLYVSSLVKEVFRWIPSGPVGSSSCILAYG